MSDYWMYSFFHLIITLPATIIYALIALKNRFLSNVDYTKASDISEKNIIVFVHGRGGHYSNFDPLIKNLDLKNFGIYRVNLGKTSNTSIHDDAVKLSDQLREFQERNIILVGLSKGGLVAMHYLTSFNDPRIVKTITISSPLKGTKIANMLPVESIPYLELSYCSKITKEIEKRAEKSSKSLYHIVPMWDHMIQPLDSSYYSFTPKYNVYYFPGYYGHIGVVNSKEVAYAIKNFILGLTIISLPMS